MCKEVVCILSLSVYDVGIVRWYHRRVVDDVVVVVLAGPKSFDKVGH
jgi:hypothetical protein